MAKKKVEMGENTSGITDDTFQFRVLQDRTIIDSVVYKVGDIVDLTEADAERLIRGDVRLSRVE